MKKYSNSIILVELVFMFEKIILAFSFILLFLFFVHPIPLQGTNVDLGHHLLLGEIITKDLVVPNTNLLSYTYPNFEFVNTHWLSDVLFFILQNSFGFNSLILLSTILVFVSFVLLFKASGKRGYFASSLLLILFLQIMSDRTDVKPEVLSYIFLSLSLFILYRFRQKFTKLIFFLPVLMLLWVNTHIYFIVGSIVTLIFLLNEFIKAKTLKSSKVKALFFVFVASLLMTLLNPNGIKGALYPVTFYQNYGYKVVENMSLFEALASRVFDITFAYFSFAIIFLLVLIAILHRKIQKMDIVIIVFFTLLGMFAVRNFPLFVIGTFVPFSLCIGFLLRKVEVKFKNNLDLLRIVIVVSVLLVSLPGIIRNFSIHGVGMGTIDNADGAIEFISKNRIRGPIFNNYNIGNYLEYRLYPNEKVFVDGRPEGYPKAFFEKDYYPSERDFQVFMRVVKKYGIKTVFYEHKNQTQTVNPLLMGLASSKDWKMVYLNSSIVIFAKESDLNGFTGSLILNKEDTDTKGEIGDLSNFFRVIGWYKKMVEMDKFYLEYEPRNCTALRHVAVVTKEHQFLEDFIKYCHP